MNDLAAYRKMLLALATILCFISLVMGLFVERNFFANGGLYGRTHELEGWAMWGVFVTLACLVFSFFARGWSRLSLIGVGIFEMWWWVSRAAAWT